MQSKQSIFWTILKDILKFLILPFLVYLPVVLGYYLATGNEVPILIDNLVSSIIYLFTVIVIFGIYKKEKFEELFPGEISIKRLLFMIPLSLAARLPIVIIFSILISLPFLGIGDQLMQISEEAVDWQWEDLLVPTGLGEGFDIILTFLNVVILSPIIEELFYRGVIMKKLIRQVSPKKAIVFSSMLFAAAHLHPGLLLDTFIIGLFFAYVFYKWNNLAYAIVLHMLVNLFPFIIGMASEVMG